MHIIKTTILFIILFFTFSCSSSYELLSKNTFNTKDDFSKKVLELTKGQGVPVVFDGVGKNTFHKSIECLKTRGMMVSFGNASGSLEKIDVQKSIQPKGLYFTRPAMWHYLAARDEIQTGADKIFERIKLGKIKVEVFKKYRLDEIIQSHEDLESRKITGPAVIIP